VALHNIPVQTNHYSLIGVSGFPQTWKPGKVREFEIWSGKFFMTCHIFRYLLNEVSFQLA